MLGRGGGLCLARRGDPLLRDGHAPARVPLAANGVCLDGPGDGCLGTHRSLTRLDTYEAESARYRCVLQKPVQTCVQLTDGTCGWRSATSAFRRRRDVASISRLLAAREATEAPPLQVRNETGAPLLVEWDFCGSKRRRR